MGSYNQHCILGCHVRDRNFRKVSYIKRSHTMKDAPSYDIDLESNPEH